MSNWPLVRFGDLASSERSSFSMGPFGSKIVKENYVSDGVPVVRGVNLAAGRFIDAEFVFLTSEKADELASANVAPGDLIFTHRGTIGQVTMIPRRPRYARYVIGSSQVKARLDNSKALSEFYYYWFRSPRGQQAILANVSTVGVPGLATPLTTIKNLVVPQPPLSVQRPIVRILEALDDKIAVNERLSTTARALGTARFLAAISSTDSQREPLSRLASLIARGGAPSYTDQSEEPLVINQKCVRGGRVDTLLARRTLGSRIRPDRYLMPGDVLINSTGVGTLGRVGLWSRSDVATCDSHVTIVRPDSAASRPIVTAYALLSAEASIEALGEGSTGQTELSRIKLGQLEAHLPAKSKSEALAPILEALESRAEAALQECQELAELRDALLPKLISGELRIKDAERLVSDAT